ncbi:N/A [soil metagenome]
MTISDLIVVGGGVTGCAVARDAALRGLRVILLEQGEVGSGTSGRFHSMLQSGSRYVVTDVAYAAECMRERRIIDRIAPFAFEATGGLFVLFDEDDPSFTEQFSANCSVAEIPATWLSADEISRQEPSLARTAGGFSVPDAVFRPWLMVPAIAQSAMENGAEIRTGTRVLGITETAEGTKNVDIDDGSGSVTTLQCSAIVVAAGTWTPEIAGQLGQKVDVEISKGAMLVVPHRPFNAVINRCRPPQSFDITVPIADSIVFGTTSSTVTSPLDVELSDDEITALIDEFATWWPAFAGRHDDWSTYAGVRPLVAQSPGEGGAVSRRHAIFSEGVIEGVFSIVGGSFTTHRAMAEDVVGRVGDYLGVTAPCRTAEEPLRPATKVHWSAEAPMRADLFARSV